ncbi:hypothetical protein J6590_022395 [Homalodisca vitripennis]|nr:hypothetical protein J6590_022395 [Homalodisca vitripennis]
MTILIPSLTFALVICANYGSQRNICSSRAIRLGSDYTIVRLSVLSGSLQSGSVAAAILHVTIVSDKDVGRQGVLDRYAVSNWAHPPSRERRDPCPPSYAVHILLVTYERRRWSVTPRGHFTAAVVPRNESTDPLSEVSALWSFYVDPPSLSTSFADREERIAVHGFHALTESIGESMRESEFKFEERTTGIVSISLFTCLASLPTFNVS